MDRDGTLIKEASYLRSVEQISPLDSAFEAVRKLNQRDLIAIVVTNQSAVARGLLTEEELGRIHDFVREMFDRQGAHISAFYSCPHLPGAKSVQYGRGCACRKPEPGLLLQAARDLSVDLRKSFMMGDSGRDIEAGHRAGCRSVLVKTGYGAAVAADLEVESRRLTAPPKRPEYVAEDLLDGAKWILRNL